MQASFLLTILGTFMTRSGVFNSVHSFTQSSIGPTILVFLAAIAALLRGAARAAHRLARSRRTHRRRGQPREACSSSTTCSSSLLTFTVLIGTVFPLVVEAVRGKQMSVGRPYFDSMVVPIGAALLFILGVGPALPWGTRDEGSRLQTRAAAAAHRRGSRRSAIGYVARRAQSAGRCSRSPSAATPRR